MRLWSISTTYLDRAGLVALWRESLLARAVLKGETKGYINHPQLIRFKLLKDPIAGINAYLKIVYDESVKRGYKFSKDKLKTMKFNEKLIVSKGQIDFEFNHLLKKLKIRDKNMFEKLRNIAEIAVNPLFFVKDGGIDMWERGNKM
ncbi:MAG: pyrimidine dimer DNA glycosylase/endonuclease V [Candidatus Dojkabacteria bacterium]|nr:pyrimidine dimer DNA glycosylase/endonuclease V [Candidatus Dojkabacteria bacterium]